MPFEKCPSCGYMEPLRNKKLNHEMHVYVTADGKVDGTYNDNADELTLTPKGKTSYKVFRQDKFLAKPVTPDKPVAPALPAKPVTPALPSAPATPALPSTPVTPALPANPTTSAQP